MKELRHKAVITMWWLTIFLHLLRGIFFVLTIGNGSLRAKSSGAGILVIVIARLWHEKKSHEFNYQPSFTLQSLSSHFSYAVQDLQMSNSKNQLMSTVLWIEFFEMINNTCALPNTEKKETLKRFSFLSVWNFFFLHLKKRIKF